MTSRDDVSAVVADAWLRTLMRIGVPLAIVSIVALWAAELLAMPALLPVFAVTGGLTLATGLAYNVRFVLLLLRRRRAAEAEDD